MTIGIPMAHQWRTFDVSATYLWRTMAYLWRIHDVPLAYPWRTPGVAIDVPMAYLLRIHGALLAYPWRTPGVPLERKTVMIINLGPNVMLRRTELFFK